MKLIQSFSVDHTAIVPDAGNILLIGDLVFRRQQAILNKDQFGTVPSCGDRYISAGFDEIDRMFSAVISFGRQKQSADTAVPHRHEDLIGFSGFFDIFIDIDKNQRKKNTSKYTLGISARAIYYLKI